MCNIELKRRAELEQDALDMLKAGEALAAVEAEIGWEIMVFNDLMTKKLHHVSLWKEIRQAA